MQQKLKIPRNLNFENLCLKNIGIVYLQGVLARKNPIHRIQQPILKSQFPNFHKFLNKHNRHAKLVLTGQFVDSKLVIGSGKQDLKMNFFLLIDQYFTQ